MDRYVLDFREIDQTQVARVGGKGAGLGELSRIDGVHVPPGFCVTTNAFRDAVAPSVGVGLDRLSALRSDDAQRIRVVALEIRRTVEAIPIPYDITTAIERAITSLGLTEAYAIRSSATAEDLPTASFAGQQDTYLNVIGLPAILEHVRRCWASLFTERATTYRLRNGIDTRKVSMAVVVQRMVFPDASGILFTADPISGNRNVVAIEAGVGLGEALVSGLTNADSYKLRDGEIIAKTIATKHLAIDASPSGGTEQRAIPAQRRSEPVLTDSQAVRLAKVGRRIEAHFGRPQDIEWCLADDDFQIVQSRPITTLFPIPELGDNQRHVFISVGHQQMMTDAWKPLGISMWQLTAAGPMFTAGGRLFVDVSRMLASQAGRGAIMKMLGRSDPLIGDMLQTVIDRKFIPLSSEANAPLPRTFVPPEPMKTDPAIVDELMENSERSIAALKAEIATKTGPELLEFIRADIQELKRILFDPKSHQVFMTAMDATWWLNEKLEEWLGEKNAADTLSLAVPNNVTSEMGLALMDVADVIRPHSAVVGLLEHTRDDDFLNALPSLPGGIDARDAIVAWLDKYGMRGVGEIDITRPRWHEEPRLMLPALLGNIRNFQPGEAKTRFEHGRRLALAKERDVLARLRALPDGDEKAKQTKEMIDRVRTFIGYREYPKYGKTSRDFVYKQALMKEAERLAKTGVLAEKEDIYYLTFPELQETVRTNHLDTQLIRDRKAAFEWYRTLTPPRVMTSEGEIIAGSYRRNDVPAGALLGLAVSSGVVEGRARVILDVADADLEPGDILVTSFTDPSWTPLFVGIEGLVTEVGGQMTHGAVIAREYGLPAVVGVVNATRLIPDGRRIRVHGTEGYVELLTGDV